MITKTIYSYKVKIKYGVYTRTIIGVSSLQSLSAPSQWDAESKLGRRILPLGFPSGTGYRGRGDNHRQRSILARRLARLLKANRWTRE